MAQYTINENANRDYLRQEGYDVYQIGRQRIIRLKEFEHFQVSDSMCEIYYCNVPPTVFEDRLFPYFNRFGRILQLRLMVDEDNLNRGYGFVLYMQKCDAQRAICRVRGTIIDGFRLNAHFSLNFNRLYIDGLPNTFDTSYMETLIFGSINGVQSVLYFRGKQSAEHGGFCFVTFESHELALKGRLALLATLSLEMETVIRVRFAKPEFRRYVKNKQVNRNFYLVCNT